MAHNKAPGVGTYLYNKGLVLSRLDRVEEAINVYHKALEAMTENNSSTEYTY